MFGDLGFNIEARWVARSLLGSQDSVNGLQAEASGTPKMAGYSREASELRIPGSLGGGRGRVNPSSSESEDEVRSFPPAPNT